jgi:hypothetical protein
MSVVIDGKDPKKVAEIISAKSKERKRKGSLAKHFGKLKRNIDGLKYQLAIREHEDGLHC